MALCDPSWFKVYIFFNTKVHKVLFSKGTKVFFTHVGVYLNLNKSKDFCYLCYAFVQALLNLKTTYMGKGDKKSRRGKIILGTYGVRRLRKKADKAAIKPKEVVMPPKPSREKKEKPQPEVKETRVPVAKEHKPKEKAEKPEKATIEKAEKTEKTEKVEKVEKAEKQEKAPKVPKAPKAEKAEKPEKSEKPEKEQKPAKEPKAKK